MGLTLRPSLESHAKVFYPWLLENTGHELSLQESLKSRFRWRKMCPGFGVYLHLCSHSQVSRGRDNGTEEFMELVSSSGEDQRRGWVWSDTRRLPRLEIPSPCPRDLPQGCTFPPGKRSFPDIIFLWISQSSVCGHCYVAFGHRAFLCCLALPEQFSSISPGTTLQVVGGKNKPASWSWFMLIIFIIINIVFFTSHR